MLHKIKYFIDENKLEKVFEFLEKSERFYSIFLVVFGGLSFYLFGENGWTIFTILSLIAPILLGLLFIYARYRRISSEPAIKLINVEDPSIVSLMSNSKPDSKFWEKLYRSSRLVSEYTALETDVIVLDRDRVDKIRQYYPEMNSMSDKAFVHALRCYERFRGAMISQRSQDTDFIPYVLLSQNRGDQLKHREDLKTFTSEIGI